MRGMRSLQGCTAAGLHRAGSSSTKGALPGLLRGHFTCAWA